MNFLITLHIYIIFCGINRIPGKTKVPLGNKIMNFYCAIVHRYPDTAGLVSKNFNGPAWNNIQLIPKKMDTAMVSPIISRSNKEAIMFFFNEHEHHLKKDYKVAAKVSIDAKK